MADIPGLIEGAAEGAGLGHRFLGHVERCSALLHLIDVTQDDLAEAYTTIRNELMAYDDGMAQKPELVALTKCDALTPELVADQKAQLSGLIKGEIIDISSVSGDGLQALYDKLISMIDADSDAAKDTKTTTSQSTTAGWHPLRGSE